MGVVGGAQHVGVRLVGVAVVLDGGVVVVVEHGEVAGVGVHVVVSEGALGGGVGVRGGRNSRGGGGGGGGRNRW